MGTILWLLFWIACWVEDHIQIQVQKHTRDILPEILIMFSRGVQKYP